MALLFALAPDGVCQAATLPPRWCALTAPFQLFSCLARAKLVDGREFFSFSVALSVGSPRPAVSWHLALRSPDFPRTANGTRPSGSLAYGILANRTRLTRGKRDYPMTICALVGASEFNAEHFQMMDAAGAFDYVIAVDGGFAHLESIGRQPDMAMGTSIPWATSRAFPVSRFSSNKDASDMELALRRAKTFGHKEIYVYGGLGGRLDHTLANLQLFSCSARRGLRSRRSIATARSPSSPAPTPSRCPPATRDGLGLFHERSPWAFSSAVSSGSSTTWACAAAHRWAFRTSFRAKR